MGTLPSDYPILFEERALADTIAHQLGKIDYVIREPSDDALLSTPTEDIVEHAYRNFRIQLVIIGKAGVSREPIQLGTYCDDDRNYRALENAFKFEVGFPFTGALGMFNHHIEEPPPRQLRAKREGGASAGELLIAVHGEDLTKKAVKEEVDREIDDIIAYMERINEQVIQYNNSIRDRVRAAVDRCTSARRAAAARRRLPAPRGARRHAASTSRDVAHALRDHPALADRGRRLPLARARCPTTACARSARSSDLEQRARRASAIDEVIIADPDFPQDDAVELVDQCHRRGVRVRLAPSTMEILIHRAEFVPGQSVPLFELGPPVFEGIDFALKRTFDIVGATLLLIAAQPAAARDHARRAARPRAGPSCSARCAAASASGRSPCLKFRTMHTDAEERQADLEELNEASGALFKIRDDPRLTPVGRLLRRFSLDELPQLVNVLRGEMSLVGPRPLPERDYEMLEDWHRKRYLVLPGITGLWQVSGRSELDFDDLVHLDFIYLERWSLALDLTILLKTIPAVLLRRGAY